MVDNTIESKYEGKLAFTELRTVEGVDEQGTAKTIVVSRMTELRIVDENTGMTYSQYDIPYGSTLYFKDGDTVKKGDLDAYNATTIVESAGTIRFENMAEGVTYREENADEYSNNTDKVIIEGRDKTKSPALLIVDENGVTLRQYNLPVGAHIMKNDGDAVKVGDVIIKIPRAIGKASEAISRAVSRA